MLAKDFSKFVALSSAALAGVAFAAPSSTPPSYTQLPTVDLGYELHQAISFNSTGQYYNFTNIRYAAPPTGNLRFRAPTSPATNRSVVQTGSEPRICPQGTPAWVGLRSWVTEYLDGQPITLTQADYTSLIASQTLSNLTAQPAGASEDCLFLDVMVPKTIFDKANSTSYSYKGAPVIVWIYGSGHTWGWKNDPLFSGNPAGLVSGASSHGREGVIFIALNYRLGALGFLNGPTLMSDGDANAGLLDQRFALEWVQQYVHLFGGDPTRVTVMGQGSGGGDTMLQLTAYGGSKGAPFAKIIPQSPGIYVQSDSNTLEAQLNRLLQLTNTTCLDELRCVDSQVLINANELQIFQSFFSGYTYAPAVDGTFITEQPAHALAKGDFAKSVEVMIGHSQQEGLVIVPILFLVNYNYTEAGFAAYLDAVFYDATQKVRDYIQYTLYPACYTGEYGYTDIVGRLALLIEEASVSCNAYYLGKAYGGKDYAYYFAIPPSTLRTDIPYTFYNGAADSVLNATSALVLQDWITTFAQNGVPKTPDDSCVPKFPMWGSKGMAMELNTTSIMPVRDSNENSRCAWWQKGLFM